ncbi:MAG: MarR family transcriptional regulator [Vibrio sp.]
MSDEPKFLSQQAIPLGRLIHLVNQQKDKLLTQVFESIDITAAQFKVLAVLGFDYCQPSRVGVALSPAEICHHLSLDAGAMTRMLQRLIDKDLIQKIPNPHDKRSVLIELTESGVSLYLECKEKIDAEFSDRFTEHLTDQEVDQLTELLLRLLPQDLPCLGAKYLPKV